MSPILIETLYGRNLLNKSELQILESSLNDQIHSSPSLKYTEFGIGHKFDVSSLNEKAQANICKHMNQKNLKFDYSGCSSITRIPHFLF